MTPDILVGFDPAVTETQAEAILAVVASGVILHRNWGNMERTYQLHTQAKNGLDVLAMANRLADRAEVRFAEPDMMFAGHAELIPNDPGFSSCWGIQNTGQFGGTPGMDMKGPQAWDITAGSSSIVVVVIDVGVQPNHPDLYQIPGRISRATPLSTAVRSMLAITTAPPSPAACPRSSTTTSARWALRPVALRHRRARSSATLPVTAVGRARQAGP